MILLLWLSVAFAQPTFQLRDVGLIGLMSHDIFAWDHKREVNTENGRLDLSTIFDYDGGARWASGGNPKNSENAPVDTVTMDLVDYYRARLGVGPVEARRQTVAHFHALLREAYERVRERPFPEIARDEMPNNTEQAALRGMHDVLPGRVKLFGRWSKELTLTDYWGSNTRLNEQEPAQPIRTFDGDYDEEYKNIKIPFGPTLSLKEIDRKFIEKFSPLRQNEMLATLAEVGRGEREISTVYFIDHLDALFTKAICPNGNAWMPAYPCN